MIIIAILGIAVLFGVVIYGNYDIVLESEKLDDIIPIESIQNIENTMDDIYEEIPFESFENTVDDIAESIPVKIEPKSIQDHP